MVVVALGLISNTFIQPPTQNMKTSRLTRNLAAAIALLIGSGAALSAAELQQAKPVFWPATPRPATKVIPAHTFFDGFPVSILNLHTLGTHIEISRQHSLVLDEGAGSRFSVAFTSTDWEGVQLGISCFDGKEFLKNLDDDQWTAYKMGLLKSNPSTAILEENSNRDGPMTPYLLGLSYRQLIYTDSPEADNPIVNRELFAFSGSTLIVVSLSGPKIFMDENRGKVDRFISEMTLVR